jgi:hypothetical protein
MNEGLMIVVVLHDRNNKIYKLNELKNANSVLANVPLASLVRE